MKYETPITDADLHAYIDGQLSEPRRLQVEAWLKAHPDKLRELNEYQIVDRELHDLLDPIVDERVPAELRIAPRKRLFNRIAAAIGFMSVGSLFGWQANTLFIAENHEQQIQHHLMRPANFAHVVYTAEKRHPVEVSAEKEQHLINWLSKRLYTKIKAPDLAQYGYALMGGRLLPSTNRMAAQFMYQSVKGKRITLYVRRIKSLNADSMFQFASSGGVKTFYWIDGELGYALSGELERKELMAMANSTYQQLTEDM